MAVGTTAAANHLKPTAQALDSARTRVWWFFGNTETSRQGMTADLEAFKEQGMGGVVYYDQVHGESQNADTLFSTAWWQNLVFAAKEAQRLGLQFDANITNGYAAGGRWITPDKGMQRLVSTEWVVTGGKTVQFKMPLHQGGKTYHHDVALLAIPYTKELMGDTLVIPDMKDYADDRQEQLLVIDLGQPTTVRSITYEVNGRGKSATSAMQMPGPPTDTFYGFGYRPLPDLGQLEASDDGQTYRPVANLKPIYTALGTWRSKTIAIPTTRCRYFRIRLHDWHSTDQRDDRLRFGHVRLSARALVDQWEEKAGLQSEFIYDDHTPSYQADEILQADRIIDLTPMMADDGTVTCSTGRPTCSRSSTPCGITMPRSADCSSTAMRRARRTGRNVSLRSSNGCAATTCAACCPSWPVSWWARPANHTRRCATCASPSPTSWGSDTLPRSTGCAVRTG